MLFYLKYINHDVEKLQKLLVYFFNKVEELNYPTTFDRNTLLPDWYCNASNTMRGLETQLTEFIAFDSSVRITIIKAFRDANNIELLFSDETMLQIPVASDFTVHQDFLSNLFTSLYKEQLSKRLQDTAPFPKIINSDIANHLKELKEVNKVDSSYGSFTVCPFCGIEEYSLQESEERPAYDHLLPEGSNLFVFSAVNLKNLFPIGSRCNKLKSTKILLYKDDKRLQRTVAFYPYDNIPHPFELINFQLNCDVLPDFRKNGTWQVMISPKDSLDNVLREKINNWIRVFNIKARYEEYIQNKDNAWIENFFHSYKTIDDVKRAINTSVANDLCLKFSFISTMEGLIPKRIFYQWALNNYSFLESFITIPNKQNNIVQDDLE